MGIPIPFRRKRRHLAAIWGPYLRPRGWPAGQLRMMIWSGMLVGLLAFQATGLALPSSRYEQAGAGAAVRVIDGDTFD